MLNELAQRIRQLQHYLAERKIDLAVLNQNADLYYYTGSIQPLYLLVPAAGEPVVLARKALERIGREARNVTLESFASTKDLTHILNRHNLASTRRVGFTLDVTSYATVNRFCRLLNSPEIVDVSWDVRTLRMIKSPAEITIQTRAGAILAGIPKLIKDAFRPGMTELELSAVVEHYFRRNGHGVVIRCRREGSEMPGFGVCSSGLNSLTSTKFEGICMGKGLSPAVPYGASEDPLEKGIPVVLDYAFVLDGYHVDQTRMFCWGPPPATAVRAYEAMVRVEQTLLSAMKPGKACEELYTQAVQLAGELGYSGEFMGLNPEKVKFVAHGVGLELDEPPYLAPGMTEPLATGMVLAVEPKVALPGIGVVGIEDTVVIGETGAERLTTCPGEWIVAE